MTERNITVDLRQVSPLESHSWLINHRFSEQRPLDYRHVLYLSHTMRQGHYRPASTIDFARMEKTGDLFLINGQHTLAAIVHSRCSQLLTVVTTECSTYEEVRELYRRHGRGKPRTLIDGYRTLGLDLPKDLVNRMGNCMSVLGAGFSSYAYAQFQAYNRDADLRNQFIEQWAHDARHLWEDVRPVEKFIWRAMCRSGALSVAMLTYRYTGQDAVIFWQGLARDDGLTQHDPRKRLLHFLLDPRGMRKYHWQYQYARVVARAWNLAYAERDLRLSLSVQPSDHPIEIAGTPHTRKNVMVYISPEGRLLYEPMVYDSQAYRAISYLSVSELMTPGEITASHVSAYVREFLATKGHLPGVRQVYAELGGNYNNITKWVRDARATIGQEEPQARLA